MSFEKLYLLMCIYNNFAPFSFKNHMNNMFYKIQKHVIKNKAEILSSETQNNHHSHFVCVFQSFIYSDFPP